VTWKTQSRQVDARRVEFGRPPLCGKCTPHPRDGLYVNVWLPDGYGSLGLLDMTSYGRG
jgi:hypothetical protein